MPPSPTLLTVSLVLSEQGDQGQKGETGRQGFTGSPGKDVGVDVFSLFIFPLLSLVCSQVGV